MGGVVPATELTDAGSALPSPRDALRARWYALRAAVEEQDACHERWGETTEALSAARLSGAPDEVDSKLLAEDSRADAEWDFARDKVAEATDAWIGEFQRTTGASDWAAAVSAQHFTQQVRWNRG